MRARTGLWEPRSRQRPGATRSEGSCAYTKRRPVLSPDARNGGYERLPNSACRVIRPITAVASAEQRETESGDVAISWTHLRFSVEWNLKR